MKLTSLPRLSPPFDRPAALAPAGLDLLTLVRLAPPFTLVFVPPPLAARVIYNIYWNHGTGGAVDFDVPYHTVIRGEPPPPRFYYTTPPLAPSGDYTFVVRAYDSEHDWEEKNVTAAFRIVTDAAGHDVTRVPRAPQGLTARASGAGSVVLTWFVLPAGPTAPAAGFRVYAGAPGAVDLAAPVLTLAADGRAAYRLRVSGLAPGPYAFVLRAFNATGEEKNTAEAPATVVPPGGPDAPLPGGSLTAYGPGRAGPVPRTPSPP